MDRASPLLLAVASAEGLALADLVYDFPPHSNWLGSWPGVPPAANRGHQTAVKGRHDAMFLQRHGRDGRILRLPSDPAGRFAITRAGGCLGVTIDVGPCVLKTIGSLGYLSLSLRLPEVVAAAVVDGPLDHWTTGPLDRLIGHPLFDGRGYVVEGVRSPHGKAHDVVEFRTGTVPYRLPPILTEI